MTNAASFAVIPEIGRELNLDSDSAVRDALFAQLQLPATAATAHGPSLEVEQLQQLLDETGSETVAVVLEHRRRAV